MQGRPAPRAHGAGCGLVARLLDGFTSGSFLREIAESNIGLGYAAVVSRAIDNVKPPAGFTVAALGILSPTSGAAAVPVFRLCNTSNGACRRPRST